MVCGISIRTDAYLHSQLHLMAFTGSAYGAKVELELVTQNTTFGNRLLKAGLGFGMAEFVLTATFPSKEQASTAYIGIRERILMPRKKVSDVAVFLWLRRAERTWCVTIIGMQPPADIVTQLTKALASGSTFRLSPAEDAFFMAQKEAAAMKQPWIEKQYFTSEDTQ